LARGDRARALAASAAQGNRWTIKKPDGMRPGYRKNRLPPGGEKGKIPISDLG